MEVLRHLAIGIGTPPLVPLPQTTSKLLKLNAVSSGTNSSSFSFTSKWDDHLVTDFQFLPSTTTNTDHSNQNLSNSTSSTSTLAPPFTPPFASTERHVSMPIDFYRILGAEAHFLGDGIRRAYEAKVSKPPQYGYSQDALVCRRQILQAACDTLANPSSRREYNQSLADDEFGTILTQVPWEKVKARFFFFFQMRILSHCSSNGANSSVVLDIMWIPLFVDCVVARVLATTLIIRPRNA